MAPSSPVHLILLDRNCDSLRVVPIQGRESQGRRIGCHVGVVGRIVDGHGHVACGLGVQLDRVGASAAFIYRYVGFREGNAPGVVVRDRDSYIGSGYTFSVVGSAN